MNVSNLSIRNSSFDYSGNFSFAGDLSTLNLNDKISNVVEMSLEGSPKLPKIDYAFDESKFSPGKSRKSSVSSVFMQSTRLVSLKKTPDRLLKDIQEKIRQIRLGVDLSFTSIAPQMEEKLLDLHNCIKKESASVSFSDVELRRIKTLMDKKVDSLQALIKPHLSSSLEFQELSHEFTKLKNQYINPLAPSK